jgi:hypothetical protein
VSRFRRTCAERDQATPIALAIFKEEAISAPIGAFNVFKDKAVGRQFRTSRHGRTGVAPREQIFEVRFEENREVLEPSRRRSSPSFLTTAHPLHAKFARLSEQEEKHGLLDDAATIGTRDGWRARLSVTGFMLRGHRLVRRKSTSE